MNANELRIGNYVHLKDKGVYQIDSGHDIDEILSHGDSDYCIGIELTPEWLDKFGFKRSTEVTWSFGYEKEYYVYRLGELTYNGIQAAWWYHGLLERQPEYVHQLQNLYSALTGTELTEPLTRDESK